MTLGYKEKKQLIWTTQSFTLECHDHSELVSLEERPRFSQHVVAHVQNKNLEWAHGSCGYER